MAERAKHDGAQYKTFTCKPRQPSSGFNQRRGMSNLPFHVPNKPEDLETDDLGSVETLRVERRDWEAVGDEELHALIQGRAKVAAVYGSRRPF